MGGFQRGVIQTVCRFRIEQREYYTRTNQYSQFMQDMASFFQVN